MLSKKHLELNKKNKKGIFAIYFYFVNVNSCIMR